MGQVSALNHGFVHSTPFLPPTVNTKAASVMGFFARKDVASTAAEVGQKRIFV